MTAQIIHFGKPNTTACLADAIAVCMEVADDTPARISVRRTDAPATATAKNQRLRKERRQAWQKADAITDYWRARLDFHHAVSMAAREGLREACLQAREFGDETRTAVLDPWRAAGADRFSPQRPTLPR